jgi:NADPH:quinone reductase-like Zn-dependent oxidoreductase
VPPSATNVRAEFLLVAVTTAALSHLAQLLDAGKLRVHVGGTLALAEASLAHKRLEGGKPAGEIVLVP